LPHLDQNADLLGIAGTALSYEARTIPGLGAAADAAAYAATAGDATSAALSASTGNQSAAYYKGADTIVTAALVGAPLPFAGRAGAIAWTAGGGSRNFVESGALGSLMQLSALGSLAVAYFNIPTVVTAPFIQSTGCP
jgi:integral membrane sensor domain MASE1